MTNVGENNVASIEDDPVLFPIIFHQDDPAASPAVPTNNVGGAAPPSQAPTENANPETSTPTAIRGGKSSSNCMLTMDGPGSETELAADHKSEFTSARLKYQTTTQNLQKNPQN